MAETASLTYADLASFPDDGLRRELFDGELLVSPAPRLRHQDVVLRLVLALGNHVARHGGGRVYAAPVDVVLSEATVLEPDLLFVSDSQLGILTDANVRGAPALVVEVLSDPRAGGVRKRKGPSATSRRRGSSVSHPVGLRHQGFVAPQGAPSFRFTASGSRRSGPARRATRSSASTSAAP